MAKAKIPVCILICKAKDTMKKLVSIMILVLCALSISAQEKEPETARPITGIEITRKVASLDIEGALYYNVVVTIKPITPDYIINDRYKVKITVTDSKGKKIWKKTLKNVYLYVFSDGQIQVGKPNFNQILIRKSSYSSDNIGAIREKEGVY